MVHLPFVVAVIAILFPAQVLQRRAESASALKTSIAIDSEKLSPAKPAVVTVKIENDAGSDVDLKAICKFELLRIADDAVARDFSMRGDSYWSPLNLSNSTPLQLIANPKMLKHGILEGRVPDEVLHFKKDESKAFEADLTKLYWNESTSSIWPNSNLFKVVSKGRYWLQLTVSSNDVLKSNRIEVMVE